ncbi:Vacuolar fusion protein MON1 homolog [Linum perenne]
MLQLSRILPTDHRVSEPIDRLRAIRHRKTRYGGKTLLLSSSPIAGREFQISINLPSMSSSDSSSTSSFSDGRNPSLKSQPLESEFQSSVTVEDSDREELASVNHVQQGVEDTENGAIDDEVVDVEDDGRCESSDQEEMNVVEETGDGNGVEGLEASRRDLEPEGEVLASSVVNVEGDSRRESSDREEINEVKETRDGIGGFVWRRTNSELDVEAEAPASPSSSGYAGERGSSSGTSGSRRDGDVSEDEILEVGNDGVDGGDVDDDYQAEWTPGKRHVNEDDASISWRKRKKHFFVLSNSGKPIYSRYGDEHKLAGFSATLQAIISFVENGGDRVKYVRAGMHQVIFLVKGPIYLVCISCTEEPNESLTGQLELLYGQMILILTKSLNRCFEKNPKFDMTPLLRGTDDVFSSLIHSFSWNPATFLHAYTCLPLPCETRQAAGAILQDVADSGVLFAILMCKHRVISLVGAQKASLHPDDMMLLANFIMSSESFRQVYSTLNRLMWTSESFSPICLPRYNPMAFLYAYVHYFDADTYLILLTTRSDAFYHLKDCRIRVETVLLKSNVLSQVQRSMLDGGMRVEDLSVDPLLRVGSTSRVGQDKLPIETPEGIRESCVGMGGPAGLWHFLYRSVYLDQYVSSEFSSPINTRQQQKRLYRAYQKLYVSMHSKGTGPHKTQFRRDETYVLLCWVTPDFELYAAFDPLADKALAIKTCNKVCQWVKDVENEIFLMGASPFSW